MSNYNSPIISDEERAQRRAQRNAVRKQKKRARRLRVLRKLSPVFLVFSAFAVIFITLGDQQPARPTDTVALEQPNFSEENPDRLPVE